MKRCSFSHSRDEDDLDDHNKNAVQAILKKSRNHIISALLKAKSPDMSDDSAGDRDRKSNGAKSDGKESKRIASCHYKATARTSHASALRKHMKTG